ncbi:MAG: glycosyltransferase family 87 protein, partial [Flavobacteriales bacterium]
TAFKDHSSMYGIPFGTEFGVTSGFYKYSPFACLPFIPFTFLSYPAASALYYFITAFLIGYFTLRMADHWLPEGAAPNTLQRWWIPTLLILLFLIDHLERELILGNVNLLLLLMSLAIFTLHRAQRFYSAGIWLAILLLFKPHFAILLPYFIWRKSWKLLLTSALSIIAGLMAPAIWCGWGANLHLLDAWMHAISDHNQALFTSPNSIYGILHHLLLAGHGGSWLVPAVLLVVASFFGVWLWQRRAKNPAGEIQWTEYFILIALIPNLVHTDTEHFLWSWPILTMIIYRMWLNADLRKPFITLTLVLAWFPYALNSPDLFGKTWSHWCDAGGLLGMANLMIVCVGLWIEHRSTSASQLPA